MVAWNYFSKEGSVTYHVEISNGRVRKCHTDQLRVRTVQPEMPDSFNPPTLPLTSTALSSDVPDHSPVEPPNGNDTTAVETDSNPSTPNHEPSAEPSNEQPTLESPVVTSLTETEHRSSRTHQPVDRFEPKW